jgi:hypothetical protein
VAIPFENPMLLDKVKVRTEVIVAMVFAMVVIEAE